MNNTRQDLGWIFGHMKSKLHLYKELVGIIEIGKNSESCLSLLHSDFVLKIKSIAEWNGRSV